MSYVHFTASASGYVSEEFNLNEYVKSLVDFVGNHVDDLPKSIQWFGNYSSDELYDIFKNYVHHYGDEVLIELDTEDVNYDSDVWDWLCDQIRQDVMTSKLMTVKQSTYNSKYGMDCCTSYYTKNGTFYGPDDIHKILEGAIS